MAGIWRGFGGVNQGKLKNVIMKTLFKLNIDGTYTSIEEIKVENNRASDYLSDFPNDYFKTFAAAKKEALAHMVTIADDWKYAVKEMRAQTKANY